MKKACQIILCALLIAAMAVSLLGCGASKSKQESSSAPEIKKVGILTGTIFDQIAAQYLPDATVEYFNSITDIPLALQGGKIDACILDEPIARIYGQQYPEQVIAQKLASDAYGFAFNKSREDLCEQMNDFLAECKKDGTMQELQDIWFGTDESRKVVETDDLKASNGQVTFAMTSSDGSVPFIYQKNGKIVGYEYDLVVRFCRRYGYGLSVIDNNFTGLIAAVSSGKADFGASCVSITEERKETMLFSAPDYIGGIVLVTEQSKGKTVFSSMEELNGQPIGVQTGSVFDRVATKQFPKSKVNYYNSATDMAVALESGKVAGYVADEPIARLLTSKYCQQHILETISRESYAFAFPKGASKSEKLKLQFNKFLKSLRADGTLSELDTVWFGDDESVQTVNMNGLTAENGTLTMAVSTDVGAPFVFLKNDNYVGYDIDLAVRFCREYGYGLTITNYNGAGLVAAITAGKCDMAASCLTVTKERAESLLFSEPDYDGGTVVVVRSSGRENRILSTEELKGKKIAVQTGTLFDRMAEEHVPGAQLEYFNTAADLALALETDKVSAYLADEPIARLLNKEYTSHHMMTQLDTISYAFMFPKVKSGSEALCKQFNQFLSDIKSNGTIQEIDAVWFGDDEAAQVVDLSDLTGKNGTLVMSACSEVGAPFCYVKDRQMVGYDIDIAARFCREYGYGLEVVDYNVGGLFTSVSGGKCDLAASCVAVTEERKETMLFSDPDYEGGAVVVVKSTVAEEAQQPGFLATIAESFNKTFIREDRWQLFLSGIGVTLLITVLSAVLGTLLGFGVFFVYRRSGGFFCSLTDTIIAVLQKTPVVVILMILYYVVFGTLDISGMWVSVLGFTLLFAGSIVGLLSVGVKAIDRGQTEAALALGYTERRAFTRIVLPQAAQYFLPGYKSAIVSLVKDTAIVGYIAVQDLTKVSDIVRSRTYEAFFPLIATAIIYFLVAWLLTRLVRRIEFHFDPKRRPEGKILKGVRTK